MNLASALTLKDLFDLAQQALAEGLAALGSPGAAPKMELYGDGSAVIESLAPADNSAPGVLTFVTGPAYLKKAAVGGAAAVIATEALAPSLGAIPAIITSEPRLVFALILEKTAPRPAPPEGGGVFAHRASVEMGPGAVVGPGAFVGRDVTIGPRTVIGPLAFIEDGVSIGADCLIHPRAVLRRGARVGDRCQIHAGAVIGEDGFGYTQLPDPAAGRLIHYKNAHVGGVVIEDDVEIGAQSTVDRGLVADTVIGRGTKIDNLVQIGHNCRIGRDCVIVSQVGIGGHTVLGDRVFLLGQVGLGPGVTIGDDAILTGQTGLGSGRLPAGRTAWSGTPAASQKEHLETCALSRSQLPKVRKFFQALKKADSFSALKETFFAPEKR